MPLGANLAADIEAVLRESNELQAAAKKLAQAYYNYTSTALFGASIPVILPAMRDLMAATLAASLDPAVGLPITAATAWSNAVNAYWTAVPVAGGSGAGVTVGCPGAGAISGGMAAVFANPANTYATCAAGMASVLQTATLTMTCDLTLPPSGPVPTPIS